MFLRFRFFLFLIVCIPLVFNSCSKDEEDDDFVLIDFQDEVLGEQKYKNNAGPNGVFTKGIVSFVNSYASDYWCGFAISQMHDMVTPGYANQFSAYAVGDNEENIFMIGYVDDYNIEHAEIRFSKPVSDVSFDIVNATYPALSMKNGDNFANKFEKDDWFELIVTVFNSSNNKLGDLTVTLAEGTAIGNLWTTIPLGGSDIAKLEFTMQSSDMWGEYMNTPAYFCLDNLRFKIAQ